LIPREFLRTTDAVVIVHAVFETGHAEGASWKQVQLFEKNAIADPLDRPGTWLWNDGRWKLRQKPAA
jgi:hypothetical protein